jgi:hypothetical protein
MGGADCLAQGLAAWFGQGDTWQFECVIPGSLPTG